MTGLPFFNAPTFRLAAENLRVMGNDVFSPVEHDEQKFGREVFDDNPTGDPIALAAKGFRRREALLVDLAYICQEADAVALLPGWRNSPGARAEYAVAVALGLNVIELE